MELHANEVMDACKKFTCNCKLIESMKADTIRLEIERRFARQANDLPLWERLHSDSSIFNRNGWRLINAFTRSRAILMFFEYKEDKSVVEIQNSAHITEILEECTGFTFYITNETVDFLLCFNDHDFLIGTGSAQEWLHTLSHSEVSGTDIY